MKNTASLALVKASSFKPDQPGQAGAGTPEGNSLFSSYSTPDWLNKADNWVNQLNPESFIQNQLGFENYENPEWLNTAGRWFGGLSPEMKAGVGVGVPLAGLALMKLLRGGNKR
jgi:hypothetical protein